MLYRFFGIIGLFVSLNIVDAYSVSISRPAMGRGAFTINASLPLGKTSKPTNPSSPQSVMVSDKECIDSYVKCLKSEEACGSKFEKCTNNNLFFAKKSMCASELMLCNSSVYTDLFGVGKSEISDKDGENYKYPKIGSFLGDLIEGARINNMLEDGPCVKKYTSCLRKSDVCGEDFELCTDKDEFERQKILCQSIWDRCPTTAKTELGGAGSGIIKTMIDEGNKLAAINSVSACYKKADQCILNACSLNPYKCKEGTNQVTVNSADILAKITEENDKTNVKEILPTDPITKELIPILNTGEATNKADVKKYIANFCKEEIGSNKLCYMTAKPDEVTPEKSDLNKEENKEDVFNDVYESRLRSGMQVKIDDLISKFESSAIKACSKTIETCAMRNCAGGSLAACYITSFAENGGGTILNNKDSIKNGCESIIQVDNACKFVASKFDTNTGIFSFEEPGNLFNSIFSEKDPIGVVAKLNANLSNSFNRQTIDKKKKQCHTAISGCVRSMCGKDFSNCFRNRTDVSGSITKAKSDKFNKSMNKEFGVLDRTIVIGLCLNTVKNTPVCEDHFKMQLAIKKANFNPQDYWNSLGNGASGSWVDSGDMNIEVQDTDAEGNLLCSKNATGEGESNRCDIEGFVFPKMILKTEAEEKQNTFSEFAKLIEDLEIEAQAKYKAKITKEQNICLANNKGGIKDNNALGGDFMWVKLKSSKKTPKNYNVMGLKSDEFVSSNDLYGSFCRMKVTLLSKNPEIKKILESEGDLVNGYFAVGDPFMCGGWIPQNKIENIATKIGDKAYDEAAKYDSLKIGWGTTAATILGAVGGGVGGYYGVKALQDKLGWLEGKNEVEQCISKINKLEKEFLEANVKLNRETKTEPEKDDEGKILQSKKGEPIYKKIVLNESFSWNINFDYSEIEQMGIDTRDLDLAVKKAIDKVLDSVNAINKDEENRKGHAKRVANKIFITDLQPKFNEIRDLCKKKDTNIKPNKDTGKKIGMGVGAGVGALAAGLGTGFTMGKVFHIKNTEARSKAEQEFINSLAEKIDCYVAGEKVGSFGDFIKIDVNEEE